jgi:argininosuccinate synthase
VGQSIDPSHDEVVTFEKNQGGYDQFDAQGFIKLNALRLWQGASAGRLG